MGRQCPGQPGQQGQASVGHHQRSGRVGRVAREDAHRAPVRAEAGGPCVGEVQSALHPPAQFGRHAWHTAQAFYERRAHALQLYRQYVRAAGGEYGVRYVLGVGREYRGEDAVARGLRHVVELAVVVPGIEQERPCHVPHGIDGGMVEHQFVAVEGTALIGRAAVDAQGHGYQEEARQPVCQAVAPFCFLEALTKGCSLA